MSTHQNTKNVTLLSTMNSACTTNAPRSASDALTLVATSARANPSVFADRVISHLPCDLSAVDGQACHGPSIRPLNGRRHHGAPEYEIASENQGPHKPGPQH